MKYKVTLNNASIPVKKSEYVTKNGILRYKMAAWRGKMPAVVVKEMEKSQRNADLHRHCAAKIVSLILRQEITERALAWLWRP